MDGLSQSVDKFLNLMMLKILDGLGYISHQQAKEKAHYGCDEFKLKK